MSKAARGLNQVVFREALLLLAQTHELVRRSAVESSLSICRLNSNTSVYLRGSN
jgi:hypothetical protein